MTGSVGPRPSAPKWVAAGRVGASAWLILALGAVLGALLLLPGQTVVTRGLDQVFAAF